LLGSILVKNNIMAVSINYKEKRNLTILFYIPVLYVAYYMDALSFRAYTFFFIVGMSCLLTLTMSKAQFLKILHFHLFVAFQYFFWALYFIKCKKDISLLYFSKEINILLLVLYERGVTASLINNNDVLNFHFHNFSEYVKLVPYSFISNFYILTLRINKIFNFFIHIT
jgi:hypothetical protein